MIEIDMVGDITSPLCFLEKRKLERALRLYSQKQSCAESSLQYKFIWHGFRNPEDPQVSRPLTPHSTFQDICAQKYGREKMQYLLADLLQKGLIYGIFYRFDWEHGGSMDFHRIMCFISEMYDTPTQMNFANRIFSAIHEKSISPKEESIYLDAARALGLDETQIQEILHSDRYSEQVELDMKAMELKGVQTSPTFIFNQRYFIHGSSTIQEIFAILQKL